MGRGSLTEGRALGQEPEPGAKLPEGGAAAEPWRVWHCARNCGHDWPPVVPAAFASFHWLAHCLMTLSPAEEAPTRDAGAEAGADGCHQGIREPD